MQSIAHCGCVLKKRIKITERIAKENSTLYFINRAIILVSVTIMPAGIKDRVPISNEVYLTNTDSTKPRSIPTDEKMR